MLDSSRGTWLTLRPMAGWASSSVLDRDAPEVVSDVENQFCFFLQIAFEHKLNFRVLSYLRIISACM